MTIPAILEGELVGALPSRARTATELVEAFCEPFVMSDGRPVARRFLCLTPQDVPALEKLRAMKDFMQAHPAVVEKFEAWRNGHE